LRARRPTQRASSPSARAVAHWHSAGVTTTSGDPSRLCCAPSDRDAGAAPIARQRTLDEGVWPFQRICRDDSAVSLALLARERPGCDCREAAARARLAFDLPNPRDVRYLLCGFRLSRRGRIRRARLLNARSAQRRRSFGRTAAARVVPRRALIRYERCSCNGLLQKYLTREPTHIAMVYAGGRGYSPVDIRCPVNGLTSEVQDAAIPRPFIRRRARKRSARNNTHTQRCRDLRLCVVKRRERDGALRTRRRSLIQTRSEISQ